MKQVQRWVWGVAALGMASATAVSAQAYNGKVTGTIDGRAVDVAVVCESAGGMLNAASDNSVHGQDVNGDGIVLSIGAMGGRVSVTSNLQGKAYEFGGSEGKKIVRDGKQITINDTFGKLGRVDGKIQLTDAFDVSLTLICD